MKHAMALALSFALTAGAWAAPSPQDPSQAQKKTSTKKKSSTTASTSLVTRRLDEMQKALEVQQQQIQQLRQDVQSRDAVIQQLQQNTNQVQTAASQAEQKADAAASQSAQQQQDVAAVRSDVTDLKSNLTSTALSLQETQKQVNESPLALRYKGVTITPGGFLAAETVWRQRAVASDVNTPFNSIPFPGASQAQMSEFFASGRQSRISMLAEGKLKSAKLSGYVEADFLSAGVTSNNNQSNSYTLRQRQAWGQAALDSGWSFTGGQMWSLITETKKGVDNRTEALPMTIDANYTAGFSWARQYGFRVAKNLSNKLWLAFSVEDSQETLTAHGNAANFVLGSIGTAGGLYNAAVTSTNGTTVSNIANYSFNPSPDFVVKAAFEPGWGHYEVFGLVSEFRDRIFPNATATVPSAAGAFNDRRTGGGVGANVRGSVFQKHVDVGAHFFGGDGIGRYGGVGLPDATVRPDGTLALIRSYQALTTLEWHSAKLDIYGNAGGEYATRTAYPKFSSTGAVTGFVGYGLPNTNNTGCSDETLPGAGNGFTPGALANCTGDTRSLIEGTIGFWYRFYNGPKGRLQWGPQYSYVSKYTWFGNDSGHVGGGTLGQPHPVENMFLTSFRYYLP